MWSLIFGLQICFCLNLPEIIHHKQRLNEILYFFSHMQHGFHFWLTTLSETSKKNPFATYFVIAPIFSHLIRFCGYKNNKWFWRITELKRILTLKITFAVIWMRSRRRTLGQKWPSLLLTPIVVLVECLLVLRFNPLLVCWSSSAGCTSSNPRYWRSISSIFTSHSRWHL